MKNILLYLEEPSQYRQNYIECLFISIRIKSQTKINRHSRKTYIAHMHSVSRGENKSPIKIEGGGCLPYKYIARFMNSNKTFIFSVKASLIMLWISIWVNSLDIRDNLQDRMRQHMGTTISKCQKDGQKSLILWW